MMEDSMFARVPLDLDAMQKAVEQLGLSSVVLPVRSGGAPIYAIDYVVSLHAKQDRDPGVRSFYRPLTPREVLEVYEAYIGRIYPRGAEPAEGAVARAADAAEKAADAVEAAADAVARKTSRRIVAVCGSRESGYDSIVRRTMEWAIPVFGRLIEPELYVTGAAVGVDAAVSAYLEMVNVPYDAMRPDWPSHGYSAGAMRSAEMAERADLLLAFWTQDDEYPRNTINEFVSQNKLVLVVDRYGKFRVQRALIPRQ